MEITTKRLLIVPCKEELLSDDVDVSDHINFYLHEIESDPGLIGWGVWLVFLKETNQFIGDIGFKGKPKNGVVEIGYGILKEAQNNGYATEAMEALINWAFQTKSVVKITAECLSDNKPSIRVLEKLAMLKTYEDEEMMYWERNLEH
ncbi:GNAT family N-acetyltransferase [uncultured Metabacillus sp.]|uniref:GNAT family N-acetyltransferase n=1 Tax=Metabacillus sp. Hm71 TaxID=3450743 RepID=UPI002613E86E|nr:GNAT family N-acetyltransferase [uncultured Metabacillus sp.]